MSFLLPQLPSSDEGPIKNSCGGSLSSHALASPLHRRPGPAPSDLSDTLCFGPIPAPLSTPIRRLPGPWLECPGLLGGVSMARCLPILKSRHPWLAQAAPEPCDLEGPAVGLTEDFWGAPFHPGRMSTSEVQRQYFTHSLIPSRYVY